MRQLFSVVWVCLLISTSTSIADESFSDQVQSAAQALRGKLEQVQELIQQGKMNEADKVVLNIFPAKDRTAAQSFVLGNMLFPNSPKLSYELHKAALEQAPKEPLVQLEWALQQHRHKNYKEAAQSYATYLKATPRASAGIWGLQAECLLRIGKVEEAVESWMQSERVKIGTIVQFERLVCEVNSGLHPHRDRAELRKKVFQGDTNAAIKLVALGCKFERDWWNNPSIPEYLKIDLDLIRASKAKFKDQRLFSEIETAVAAHLESEKETPDVASLLKERSLIFDADQTLPVSGLMASCILAAYESSTDQKFSDSLREKILKRAEETKDAEYYNIAAHMFLKTDRIAEIQRKGWTDTKDERFATTLLYALIAAEKLKSLDDPILMAIQKEYPENSLVMYVVVSLARENKKPMTPVLIQAIKAEYRKFSLNFYGHPDSLNLRKYFLELAKLVEKK